MFTPQYHRTVQVACTATIAYSCMVLVHLDWRYVPPAVRGGRAQARAEWRAKGVLGLLGRLHGPPALHSSGLQASGHPRRGQDPARGVVHPLCERDGGGEDGLSPFVCPAQRPVMANEQAEKACLSPTAQQHGNTVRDRAQRGTRRSSA
eukprot:scaffold7375_cov268-Pinguiococcus_pyrenoidosus.AAC.48